MLKIDLNILFWFYKKLDICKNRLQILKKYCPNLKIYGLFGGRQSRADIYKKKLGQYLNDFYISPFIDSYWKWINGDLMILDWYFQRGKKLLWDSIAVIQWDTLVFDDLNNLFPGIKKGEIFLSGLRTLNKKLEKKWVWTQPDDPKRKTYLDYLHYIRQNYGYLSSPICCQFIFAIFPQLFFEKYSKVKDKEIGMLEYKIPTYAKIFKIPFYQKDLGIYWHQGSLKNKAMNALPIEIDREMIRVQLEKKNGWRIFHPYYRVWPISKSSQIKGFCLPFSSKDAHRK